MFDDLRPWVPSRVCLACDGCCRFDSADSVWRPRVEPEERGDPALSAHGPAADGRLETAEYGGRTICIFFHPGARACAVYPHRPFECRLYPFLLTRRHGRLRLCVHLNCPFVEEFRGTASYRDYVAYLREYFRRADVRRVFLERKEAFPEDGEWTEEVEEVLSLEEDDVRGGSH